MKRGRRARTHPKPSIKDRSAVRAAVGEERFQAFEALRSLNPVGETDGEVFWREVLKRVLEWARNRPHPQLTILRARIGHACAGLGMSESDTDQLLLRLDFDAFVSAAKLNRSIQAFQTDERYRDLWTGDSMEQNPPIRVEFEHAVVLSTVSDAGAIARNKNWGKIVGLSPLFPDDPLYPMNITYLLKASSKQKMRWDWRNGLRHLLGPQRRLVTAAMQRPKKEFLKWLSAENARTLRVRLQLDPAAFWTTVHRGEKFGPDGIATFIRHLEETTKGYRLDFAEQTELIQIQLVC